MHRKIYQLKAGSLANMKLLTVDLTDPASDEVQIEVKAIGLNFADVFAIWGLYSATPKGEFIPGLEYAGVVSKVGSSVTHLKVGDRVMGVTRFGAYATHLNIDARYAISMPTDWSFEEGSAYLVQVLTAYYGLIYLGNIQPKDTVLIHSAAGGVGIWANRIAKQYDAFTIGSIGSDRKIDFLKQEGYNQIIVRDNNFKTKLETALGDRELNIIMECIGGEIFNISYNALAPQGRMIIYGSARYASPNDRPNYLKLFWQFFRRPKIDPTELVQNNRALMGFNLIWLYEKADLLHQLLGELSQMNLGKPHVGHTFDFENLPDAIREFQTGGTIGKLVVTVN